MFRKLNRLMSVIALLGLIVGWGIVRGVSPVAAKAAQPLTVQINQGDGLSAVAQRVSALSRENGGSLSTIEVMAIGFAMDKSGDFKVGDYEFSAKTSLAALINKFAKGDVASNKIRIAEGAQWRDILLTLSKADLTHDAQTFDVNQAAAALNMNSSSVEGMLFPDTYHYRKGEAETAVLARAHQILLKKLNTAWVNRAPNLPYASPYEALIMASLVEKETGTASDRAKVAAVFVNRLKIPMRLQTDPSVIYGMGTGFTGNITKADLQRATPFNTYTQDGLPPTPIATASNASIEAALHPAESSALYFVARGDGSSQFSDTLAQHNAAVQQYQLKK